MEKISLKNFKKIKCAKKLIVTDYSDDKKNDESLYLVESKKGKWLVATPYWKGYEKLSDVLIAKGYEECCRYSDDNICNSKQICEFRKK